MRFTLTVSMDDDAMATNPQLELGGLLTKLAGEVLDGVAELKDGSMALLRDINGNTVGGWIVSSGEEDVTQAVRSLVDRHGAERALQICQGIVAAMAS